MSQRNGSRIALPVVEFWILALGSLLALAGLSHASESAGPKVIQLASGRNHVCAVVEGGKVKCWGENIYGQLGIGDDRQRGDSPSNSGAKIPYTDLGTGRTVKTLWGARNHTCASLDNGMLKCWGRNESGRLGLGDEEFRGDQPGEMGDKLPAVQVGAGRTVVHAALGLRHTCAILDNKVTKCWGNNDSGQLGYEDTNYRGHTAGTMGDKLPGVNLGIGRYATSLALGLDHSCAILDNQRVKCWGYNGSGELGNGSTNSAGATGGTMGEKLAYVDLGTGRKAQQIVAGGDFTCALLDDASVKCWGENFSGQLGLGDSNSRGSNATQMGDNLGVVELETGLPVIGLGAGETHVCALLLPGYIKCWGQNGSGQLGLGDRDSRGDNPNEMGGNLAAVDLGPFRQVTVISGGGSNTCAMFADGGAKCWGDNSEGQLGLGDTRSRGSSGADMGDALAEIGF